MTAKPGGNPIAAAAQWADQLAELEAASRRKQEKFMNGIADRLGRERIRQRPEHPYRGAPEEWRRFEWSGEERIRQFTANFEMAGGHVVHLVNMEQAARFMADKCAEMSAKTLLRQHEPALEQLGLERLLPDSEIHVWNAHEEMNWRAIAARADIGIVIADHAVAYTGSLVVMSSEHKGRAVSLLPAVLMAVIPVERLRTRLGEVLVRLDKAGREQLPAGVHFISGPSRSADIENDLTIGVHGPGIVYAILVDTIEH
ncbi:lactate utilization protein [Paenibacillus sp. FSL M8-0334]|uniref:LutC/YkgG family protein n=1 Tax=Paenibacillus sp. FSL M8-0334 TaxID=2921623 RepID=UPI0030FC0F0A